MALFGHNKSEGLCDDTLGIKLVKEGRRLKVVIGKRSVLFADVDPEQFLHDYRESLPAIRLNFDSTTINGNKLEFTTKEREELTQDIIFHWMRFYISTRQPVRITQKHVAHPQTWAIVLRRAEEKYGLKSANAVGLAGHTVGVSASEFERWMRVEDDRMNLM